MREGRGRYADRQENDTDYQWNSFHSNAPPARSSISDVILA